MCCARADICSGGPVRVQCSQSRAFQVAQVPDKLQQAHEHLFFKNKSGDTLNQKT